MYAFLLLLFPAISLLHSTFRAQKVATEDSQIEFRAENALSLSLPGCPFVFSMAKFGTLARRVHGALVLPVFFLGHPLDAVPKIRVITGPQAWPAFAVRPAPR